MALAVALSESFSQASRVLTLTQSYPVGTLVVVAFAVAGYTTDFGTTTDSRGGIWSNDVASLPVDSGGPRTGLAYLKITGSALNAGGTISLWAAGAWCMASIYVVTGAADFQSYSRIYRAEGDYPAGDEAARTLTLPPVHPNESMVRVGAFAAYATAGQPTLDLTGNGFASGGEYWYGAQAADTVAAGDQELTAHVSGTPARVWCGVQTAFRAPPGAPTPTGDYLLCVDHVRLGKAGRPIAAVVIATTDPQSDPYRASLEIRQGDDSLPEDFSAVAATLETERVRWATLVATGDNRLAVFYVQYNALAGAAATCYWRESQDGGATWSAAEALTLGGIAVYDVSGPVYGLAAAWDPKLGYVLVVTGVVGAAASEWLLVAQRTAGVWTYGTPRDLTYVSTNGFPRRLQRLASGEFLRAVGNPVLQIQLQRIRGLKADGTHTLTTQAVGSAGTAGALVWVHERRGIAFLLDAARPTAAGPLVWNLRLGALGAVGVTWTWTRSNVLRNTWGFAASQDLATFSVAPGSFLMRPDGVPEWLYADRTGALVLTQARKVDPHLWWSWAPVLQSD
jgi:hypothetical protein